MFIKNLIIKYVLFLPSYLPLAIKQSPHASVALVSRQDELDPGLRAGMLLEAGVHGDLVVVRVRRQVVL